jgi:hypothetical protein
VGAPSNSAVFQRVWDLYAAGRGREILEHLDPRVIWRPSLLEPAEYHGHDGEPVVDTVLACVAEFRRGLVVRASSFVSVDEALAWVSGRPALP